jgi:hypothetical protein
MAKGLQRIEGEITIRGKVWEYSVFHPLRFEDQVYAVRFHEKGQMLLDRFSQSTMLEAKSSRDALKKGAAELERRGYL